MEATTAVWNLDEVYCDQACSHLLSQGFKFVTFQYITYGHAHTSATDSLNEHHLGCGGEPLRMAISSDL